MIHNHNLWYSSPIKLSLTLVSVPLFSEGTTLMKKVILKYCTIN